MNSHPSFHRYPVRVFSANRPYSMPTGFGVARRIGFDLARDVDCLSQPGKHATKGAKAALRMWISTTGCSCLCAASCAGTGGQEPKFDTVWVHGRITIEICEPHGDLYY